jgi:hypothetical protein
MRCSVLDVSPADCPFIFPGHDIDEDHEHDSQTKVIEEVSKCEAGTLQASVELDMLPSALVWLSRAAAADPGMYVAFDPSLTKTQRAVVHRYAKADCSPQHVQQLPPYHQVVPSFHSACPSCAAFPRLVEQRFSQHLEARSTGTGAERSIGVWPKGAAPGT